MSTSAEKVCLDALSLPRNARAQIAHRLLVSLEDEDFAEDVSDAWRDELERRRQDFRAGTANAVTAEEAIRRAEAVLR